MSYIPTEWNTGDIVTAEKLNKLENGVAGGRMVVTFSEGPIVSEDPNGPVYLKSDQTAEEVLNALKAGGSVVFHIPECDGWGVDEIWICATGSTDSHIAWDQQNLGYDISSIEINEDGYIHAYIIVY